MHSSRRTAPLAALLTIACSTPIASRLDEQDANEVVGALNSSGIAATKEHDPDHDGRWTVTVGAQDSPGASEALQSLGLPRRHSPGVLEALGDDAIVSSPAAEQARWSAGTAAELERSLEGISNVLSARVHLAIALPQGFAAEDEPVGPNASVLMQYKGPQPPLSSGDIQRLVAGAVPGLTPGSVEVVLRANSTPSRTREPTLTRFGPLTVPLRAAAPLRLAVAVAAAACLSAIALALGLWFKLRRIEAFRVNHSSAYLPAESDASSGTQHDGCDKAPTGAGASTIAAIDQQQ